MKKLKNWLKEEPIEKVISIIFLLILALLLSADVAHAQAARDSTTTQTYIVKSTKEVLKVYVGKSGGLYVWRTSAKGSMYKQYLKKEETK